MDGIKEKGDAKKTEILFRCSFAITDPSEATIMKYLTDKFKGIEINSLKVYDVKNSVKATVTSNVADLLLKGCDAIQEKEIRKGDGYCQMCSMLPMQIVALTQQLSEVDGSKSQLEEENKELKDRINELSQKAIIREEANDLTKKANFKKTPMNMEVVEELIAEKQKQLDEMKQAMEIKIQELKEEKDELQNKIGVMTLKVLEESDKVKDVLEKANKVNELENVVKELMKDNEKGKANLNAMEMKYKEKTQECNEASDKIRQLEDKFKQLTIESEAKDEDISKLQGLEAKAKLNDEMQVYKKSAERLENIKKNLESENEVLKKQMQDIKKEKVKNNAANYEKVKAQLKEKEEEVKKLKERVISYKELHTRIEELKTDNLRLETIIKITEESKARLEQDIIILRNTVKELKIAKDSAAIKVAEEIGSVTEKEMNERKEFEKKLGNEIKEREDKGKTITEVQLKELSKFKEDVEAKARQIEVQKELISGIQKEIKELNIKNKRLQLDADEKNAAVEEMKALKKKQELLINENGSLKEALLEQGKDNTKPKASVNNGDNLRAQILEEIKEMLTNAIYAYKTLSSNMKDFRESYEEKKLRMNNFFMKVERVNNAKRKEEYMEIIKNLEESSVFLKGIPNKVKEMTMVIACLNGVSAKKKEKMKYYNDQIARFKEIIDISDGKASEFEEKLAFYY